MHGFRPNKETETAVSSMLEDIKDKKKRKIKSRNPRADRLFDLLWIERSQNDFTDALLRLVLELKY